MKTDLSLRQSSSDQMSRNDGRSREESHYVGKIRDRKLPDEYLCRDTGTAAGGPADKYKWQFRLLGVSVPAALGDTHGKIKWRHKGCDSGPDHFGQCRGIASSEHPCQGPQQVL
jgi:hypothetical protein